MPAAGPARFAARANLRHRLLRAAALHWPRRRARRARQFLSRHAARSSWECPSLLVEMRNENRIGERASLCEYDLLAIRREGKRINATLGWKSRNALGGHGGRSRSGDGLGPEARSFVLPNDEDYVAAVLGPFQLVATLALIRRLGGNIVGAANLSTSKTNDHNFRRFAKVWEIERCHSCSVGRNARRSHESAIRDSRRCAAIDTHSHEQRRIRSFHIHDRLSVWRTGRQHAKRIGCELLRVAAIDFCTPNGDTIRAVARTIDDIWAIAAGGGPKKRRRTKGEVTRIAAIGANSGKA